MYNNNCIAYGGEGGSRKTVVVYIDAINLEENNNIDQVFLLYQAVVKHTRGFSFAQIDSVYIRIHTTILSVFEREREKPRCTRRVYTA